MLRIIDDMLDLHDCYLKLERARRHIAELETVLSTYLGTEPYEGVFGLRKGDVIGMIHGKHVDRQMSAKVDIAFGEPKILTGHSVVETLKALAGMVERVLKFFESRTQVSTPAEL